MNPPLTKADAEKRRYNKSWVTPKGKAFDPACCAGEVSYQSGWRSRQCLRKPGKGPDELYCAMHAKMLQKQMKHRET